MRASVAVALVLSALFLRPEAAGAIDCDGAVATTRLRIDSFCPCDVATSHGAYVRCAAAIAKEYVAAGVLPRACRGAVMRCIARSTCGRPGTVTCCRTGANGTSRCAIERDASRCQPPRSGTVSVGAGSCCDACITPAGRCGDGVLDPGETCDLPAFDPRCAEAPPILDVQCVPPGKRNQCLCCPAACIVPGGGCCPGLTCVERPGQVGQVRLGDCVDAGGSPDGAFVRPRRPPASPDGPLARPRRPPASPDGAFARPRSSPTSSRARTGP